MLIKNIFSHQKKKEKNILVKNYQETINPSLHHHPGPWYPAVTVTVTANDGMLYYLGVGICMYLMTWNNWNIMNIYKYITQAKMSLFYV